jgi:hypothetical protein
MVTLSTCRVFIINKIMVTLRFIEDSRRILAGFYFIRYWRLSSLQGRVGSCACGLRGGCACIFSWYVCITMHGWSSQNQTCVGRMTQARGCRLRGIISREILWLSENQSHCRRGLQYFTTSSNVEICTDDPGDNTVLLYHRSCPA